MTDHVSVEHTPEDEWLDYIDPDFCAEIPTQCKPCSENRILINRLQKTIIDLTKSKVYLQKKLADEIKINKIKEAKDKSSASNTGTTLNCDKCEFKGKDMKELKGHFKFTHLKCDKCARFFFSEGLFKAHMMDAHPKCKRCGITFLNKKIFLTHMMVKHSHKKTPKVAGMSDTNSVDIDTNKLIDELRDTVRRHEKMIGSLKEIANVDDKNEKVPFEIMDDKIEEVPVETIEAVGNSKNVGNAQATLVRNIF